MSKKEIRNNAPAIGLVYTNLQYLTDEDPIEYYEELVKEIGNIAHSMRRQFNSLKHAEGISNE